jgi:hypothetical protein
MKHKNGTPSLWRGRKLNLLRALLLTSLQLFNRVLASQLYFNLRAQPSVTRRDTYKTIRGLKIIRDNTEAHTRQISRAHANSQNCARCPNFLSLCVLHSLVVL